jgi:hypothetical protein
MKPTLAVLVIALLSFNILACGSNKAVTPAPQASQSAQAPDGATTSRSTPTASPHGYLNDSDNDVIGDADNDNNHDNDNDNSEDHKPEDNGSYHDSDDSIAAFGHAASATDRQAITATVKRYYAIASSGDGSKACSVLIPSLAKAVPEDYGQGSAGPAYLRTGRTCPAVMALLFKSMRAQLAAPVNVTGVRISGHKAVALLGSTTTPASEISIQRKGGVWMIGSVIGGALP